jgi:hypothetical protein
MKIALVVSLTATQLFFSSGHASAQGFGEYGRAVGTVPHGGGAIGPGTSSGLTQGSVSGAGVRDLGGRAMPLRLIVHSKNAGLFSRQDEEAEKITQLSEGENLVPMVQSEGGQRWYMVRTKKGLVGWIKSSDVREDPDQKKK